jgi:hypothetical protein
MNVASPSRPEKEEALTPPSKSVPAENSKAIP